MLPVRSPPASTTVTPTTASPIPDHGELWCIPTTAVPTKNGITTVWHGLRFGYRLTRKLYLDGPSLKAEYTLINLAPFDLRFVWSPHALLSMERRSSWRWKARPPSGGVMTATATTCNGPSSGRCSRTAATPTTRPPADLSLPGAAPAAQGVEGLLDRAGVRAARVFYPSRGRSLRIEFTSADLAAYWSIWINTGGWAGHRHAVLAARPAASTSSTAPSATAPQPRQRPPVAATGR